MRLIDAEEIIDYAVVHGRGKYITGILRRICVTPRTEEEE